MSKHDIYHPLWYRWFAWYPVRTTDDKWVWLREVEYATVFDGRDFLNIYIKA